MYETYDATAQHTNKYHLDSARHLFSAMLLVCRINTINERTYKFVQQQTADYVIYKCLMEECNEEVIFEDEQWKFMDFLKALV